MNIIRINIKSIKSNLPLSPPIGKTLGGDGKMLLKNICEGVYMLVTLPAISLQAYKFTKNELLHTYFSNILARL